MAQLTVELKTICENYWLHTHPEYTIDWLREVHYSNIIENAWNYIFDFNFPIWKEDDRKKLCCDIIMHYYNREIGMETFRLWQQRMDTRLNEIMPYYVRLMETEGIMGNPFVNVDLSTSQHRAGDENKKDTGEKSGKNSSDREGKDDTSLNSTKNSETTAKTDSNSSQDTTRTGTQSNETHQTGSSNNSNLFSDTPQDGLQYVAQGKYLTNATLDNGSEKSDITGTASDNETGTQTMESHGSGSNISEETGLQTGSKTSKETSGTQYNDDYSFNSIKNFSEFLITDHTGFSGDKVETLMKYRESLLQIPRMIIRDLADLFISILW